MMSHSQIMRQSNNFMQNNSPVQNNSLNFNSQYYNVNNQKGQGTYQQYSQQHYQQNQNQNFNHYQTNQNNFSNQIPNPPQYQNSQNPRGIGQNFNDGGDRLGQYKTNYQQPDQRIQSLSNR